MANLTKKQLLWNDFHILPGDVFDTKDTRFFEEKNMMAIGFSYDEESPVPHYDTTLYCYRVALRALGFRITKHFTQVQHHFSLKQQVFITNMPKTVYDANPKIEDCESEEQWCYDSDSESDDDDSSVESEPTDENPSDSSNGK